MRCAWLLVVSALLASGTASAEDTYDGVEYISGKSGLEKKVKGHLKVEEQEVRFDDGKGNLVFSIPTAEIDKAEAGAEREEGSFGRKMALGIFASKTQEYLEIEWHNATAAEAVVFKVKKKTGAGMAAKINFFATKARGATSGSPAPAAPASETEHP